MIFTIEPMINAGKFGCRLDDDWSLQLAVKS
ncbi:methionine aminopeptidase [Vibrio cholerae]|nr:methionine aminopeptidase [Vibrio cholerae]